MRVGGGSPPSRRGRKSSCGSGRARTSPPLTEGAHGVAWDRPVLRLRDTLTAVRALLAGELADAWVAFLWARGRIHGGRALRREREARAAEPAPTEVAVSVPVALAPTEDEARRLAAWWAGTYGTRRRPLYPRMPAEGFGMRAGADTLHLVLPPGRPEEQLAEILVVAAGATTGAHGARR